MESSAGASGSIGPERGERSGTRIRSHGAGLTSLSWVAAVVWNGVVGAALVLVWGAPGRAALAGVLLVFAGVGLLILAWTVYRTLAWIRFGASELEMPSSCGVIGGRLEGLILTRLEDRPTAPVRLTLSCVRVREVRPSRIRHHRDRFPERTTEILWQGDHTVLPDQLAAGPGGWSIPVRLSIPSGLQPTSSNNPREQVVWSLSASADLPGVDFAAVFTVPVRRTMASRPELTRKRFDELDG